MSPPHIWSFPFPVIVYEKGISLLRVCGVVVVVVVVLVILVHTYVDGIV